MTCLVFFLEEPSAKEMLKGLLPRILPEGIDCLYVVFEGKQDLEKRLPIRLKAWQQPEALFVVMRDQDCGDCIQIKNNLVAKCADAGKPNTLVRIACRELESFYLGDLAAVAQAVGPSKLARHQNSAKFRNPDHLPNPALELKKLAPNYQKVAGSRVIGHILNLEHNRSTSFNMLVSGIRHLVEV